MFFQHEESVNLIERIGDFQLYSPSMDIRKWFLEASGCFSINPLRFSHFERGNSSKNINHVETRKYRKIVQLVSFPMFWQPHNFPLVIYSWICPLNRFMGLPSIWLPFILLWTKHEEEVDKWQMLRSLIQIWWSLVIHEKNPYPSQILNQLDWTKKCIQETSTISILAVDVKQTFRRVNSSCIAGSNNNLLACWS